MGETSGALVGDDRGPSNGRTYGKVSSYVVRISVRNGYDNIEVYPLGE